EATRGRARGSDPRCGLGSAPRGRIRRLHLRGDRRSGPDRQGGAVSAMAQQGEAAAGRHHTASSRRLAGPPRHRLVARGRARTAPIPQRDRGPHRRPAQRDPRRPFRRQPRHDRRAATAGARRARPDAPSHRAARRRTRRDPRPHRSRADHLTPVRPLPERAHHAIRSRARRDARRHRGHGVHAPRLPAVAALNASPPPAGPAARQPGPADSATRPSRPRLHGPAFTTLLSRPCFHDLAFTTSPIRTDARFAPFSIRCRYPWWMDLTASLVGALPKAALHDHLDGGLRAETVLELSQELGLEVPGLEAPLDEAPDAEVASGGTPPGDVTADTPAAGAPTPDGPAADATTAEVPPAD